jgi:hypothetical protein
MDNVEAVGTTALLASVLVPLVSYIKKPTWSDRAKYAIGMVAAVVAAVVGAFADADVNSWQEVLTLVLVALGTSQTIYNMYFRDTSINTKLTGM